MLIFGGGAGYNFMFRAGGDKWTSLVKWTSVHNFIFYSGWKNAHRISM